MAQSVAKKFGLKGFSHNVSNQEIGDSLHESDKSFKKDYGLHTQKNFHSKRKMRSNLGRYEADNAGIATVMSFIWRGIILNAQKIQASRSA